MAFHLYVCHDNIVKKNYIYLKNIKIIFYASRQIGLVMKLFSLFLSTN